MGFSTTSAIYYITNNQGLAFSTTSANYFLTGAQGLAFSTTSASYFLSQNQGLGFATTSAAYFVSSSTTIPKTYAANIFTNTNTFGGSSIFNGALTLGSLNGPLQANGGVVSATTSIGIGYGGTGLTSAPAYGQLLLGQSNGTYALDLHLLARHRGRRLRHRLLRHPRPIRLLQRQWDNADGDLKHFPLADGNIGIGTTSPSAALAVAGTFLVGGTATLATTTISNAIVASGPYVDVRAFGAKDDGTGDNGPAFTAAAQSLSLINGGTIVVPPGTYNFNTSFIIPQFTDGAIVTIEMSGATLKTSQPIAIFKRVPTDQTNAETIVGAIFRINGGVFQGTNLAGQIGIQLDATYGSVMDGTYFQNLDVGFDGAFDLMMRIENSRTINNSTVDYKIKSGAGNWSGASVTNSQSNATSFENDRVDSASNATASFMILASDGVTIRNCISEGNDPTSEIYFDDQNSTTVKSFDVDNFHSENSPTNAVITMRGMGTGIYTFNRIFAQTASTLLDNNGQGISTYNISNIPWTSSFTTAFKLSAGTGGVYGTMWNFINWGGDITNSSWWQNGNVPIALVAISHQMGGYGAMLNVGGTIRGTTVSNIDLSALGSGSTIYARASNYNSNNTFYGMGESTIDDTANNASSRLRYELQCRVDGCDSGQSQYRVRTRYV